MTSQPPPDDAVFHVNPGKAQPNAAPLRNIENDPWGSTRGAEVHPNDVTAVNQPWHRVALPSIGLLVDEIVARPINPVVVK